MAEDGLPLVVHTKNKPTEPFGTLTLAFILAALDCLVTLRRGTPFGVKRNGPGGSHRPLQALLPGQAVEKPCKYPPVSFALFCYLVLRIVFVLLAPVV